MKERYFTTKKTMQLSYSNLQQISRKMHMIREFFTLCIANRNSLWNMAFGYSWSRPYEGTSTSEETIVPRAVAYAKI